MTDRAASGPREGAEVIAAITQISPLVRAAAAAAERAGELSPAVVAAMVEQQLFRLWVPASIGGGELPLLASLEAFEEMSRVDGAAGWAVTIGTGGGLFAAYLDLETAGEIFGPPDALIAGSGAPTGGAEIVDRGYRAHGSWRYASGAPHATWFTANCVLERDGRPLLDPTGAPRIRAMAFPASAVEIAASWDVTGLRATASHDFAAIGQFVPARRSFSVFTDEPREHGPLYRVPFGTIAELSFAAVALGIGRHALEAFLALAPRPGRGGTTPALGERADARIRVAEAEASMRSARAFLYESAAAVWSTVVSDREPGGELERRTRLAAVHAAATAARVTDSLYAAAGMSPLFQHSELGRCWRDAHAVSQHALVASARLEEIGSGLFADASGPAL